MMYEQLSPDQLREFYVRATPRQRYQVALARIEHPEHGPSLLVNVISALEGFARTVAVQCRVASGESIEKAYASLRNVAPVELLASHICPSYGTTPEATFGPENWAKLPEAVKFRNLLVHEATYLDGGTCNSLIAAGRSILDRLAAMSGAA